MPPQPGLIEVQSASEPFPGIRRVEFTGEPLSKFPFNCAAGHIKLFFPHTPTEVPDLPHRDSEGRKVWPAKRPITRTYSVRAFDGELRRLSVEFVLHGAPGPASDWARIASPGLRIGIAGPAVPEVLAQTPEWNLFVGDLSALPMISALVEQLPATSRALVLLELPTTQPVTFDTRCELTTIQTCGTTGQTLPGLVADVKWPSANVTPRVCVAAESSATITIRRYIESRLHLPKTCLYTVPYWKHTATEEEYHQERHAQMDAMDSP